MKYQSAFTTLIIMRKILSFTFFCLATIALSGQTNAIMDINGVTTEPDTLGGPYSTNSSDPPFYYFPNYPSYEQVQADGICVATGGTGNETVTINFTIPSDNTFCGFIDYGWFGYTYIGTDDCAPFSFTIDLKDANGNSVPKDSDTDMRPVIPGQSYSFTIGVSTGSSDCTITQICPSPVLVKTEFKIDHLWTDGTTDEVLQTFDSEDFNFFFDFKVCSDGDMASKFDIQTVNDFGGCANDFSIRIKEDPTGDDEEQYGKFGSPTPMPTGAVVEYTHPEKLQATNNGSKEDYKLELYDEDYPDYVAEEIDIEVYRAPVLMVHGLWSNNQAFEDLESSLDGNFFSGLYESAFLHRADYSGSNATHFSNNSGVLPNSINKLIKKVKDTKTSVGKVDVIGHSMGGLLTRLYLKNAAYNEDISRLITLNSPHSGSQLANLLMDNTYARQAQVHQFASKYLGNPNGGAVSDLRVDGTAIDTDLNGGSPGTIVPSYAITSTKALPSIPNNLQVIPKFGWMALIDDDINAAFGNEQHDWVVAHSSQVGGLGATSTTPNVNHTGSPESSTIIDLVKTLLKESISSTTFSNGGFSPPNLNYSTPPANNNNSENTNATIAFNSPANGDVFEPGDVINIDIEGSNEITEIYLSISYAIDSIYMMKESDSELNVNFTLDNISGKKELLATGKTADGTLISNNITIYSCPSEITVNNQIISTSDYFASNSITSNGSIEDESKVYFSAENEIVLNAGFNVELGTTFTGEINVCDNTIGSNTFNNENEVEDKK